MKIKCPACAQVLAIPDSAAGQVVKCPCGKQLRAPANPQAVTPPAASPGAGGQGLSGAPAGRPAGRPTPQRPPGGMGDLDPGMFDELTADDLKPVRGAVNPYSPVATPSGGGKLLSQYAPRDGGGGRKELASVGSRIAGAIIDGMFAMLFVGIGFGVAVTILISAGEQPTNAQAMIAYGIIGVAAMIPAAINITLISMYGQSLGKKVVGTRMVDQSSGAQSGFVQGFLVRSVVFGFITQVPVVGFVVAIADIVYLFTDDSHQTLHDKLAKTIVVKA